MTRATLDSFESALLADLRSHVEGRSAARVRRRHVSRRALGIAAAAAIAASAAGGALALRPAPAFAVERQADGDVVVTVRELSDAVGLERALAKSGVAAEVTYDRDAVRPTDLDDGTRPTACPAAVGDIVIDPDGGGFTLTLARRYVAAHEGVLHLTAAGGRTRDDWMAVRADWEGAAC